MLVTKADGCNVVLRSGTKICYEGELNVERIKELICADVLEVCETVNPNEVMFIDEEGKLRGKKYNRIATLLYQYAFHNGAMVDYIVGTVMFVPRKVYDKLNEEIESQMLEEDYYSP